MTVWKSNFEIKIKEINHIIQPQPVDHISHSSGAEKYSADPQGDIFFQVAGLDGAALTVKIRNFRLEVKEGDRENINNALSAVENIDNKKKK